MRRSVWLLMGKVAGQDAKPRGVYFSKADAKKRLDYLAPKKKATYWIEKVPYFENSRGEFNEIDK